MLQWAKAEELKNTIFILGGFHTQMTFSKAIGKYLESSGINDIWVESDVFGQRTSENILKGKLWNHVIRAHKLSYEALWRVLWPILMAWAKKKGQVQREICQIFQSSWPPKTGQESTTAEATAAYSFEINSQRVCGYHQRI